MKNSYYKTPKSSWLMRQFWKAAGADRYLLERSTYSDQVKYFCLGGIVIATGVMAGLAGGYAIYTIFEPKGNVLDNMFTDEMVEQGVKALESVHTPTMLAAITFGIIWGLIIFNIDRFIVTSTGKGDGTEAITKQEFKSAIPRILMGMIIALTISKPMEIRMFQSEINAELRKEQRGYYEDLAQAYDKEFDVKIAEQQAKIDKKDSLLTIKENRYVFLENTFNAETGGDRGPRGYGPEAKKIEEQMKRLDQEIQKMKASNKTYVDNAYKEIDKLEGERDDAKDEAKVAAKGLDGLLKRLQLAHKVAGFWISLFITLLFMVIELTPIFFKMMLIKGPYDYLDENVRELVRAEAGIEIEYDFYEDKQGAEAHKVINHAAELKRKERIMLLKAQDELNEEIIQKWKAKKKRDIENDPDSFISGS